MTGPWYCADCGQEIGVTARSLISAEAAEDAIETLRGIVEAAHKWKCEARLS